MNQPWKWGAKAGNLWRTTHDIKPFWASMLAIYEMNVRLYKYAQVGAWNDPDMLEVGVGQLNMEENKTHFSLWCMMAAPLILGNDIRKFINPDGTVDEDNKVLAILKNKELIAVDQDKRGIQAKRIFTDGISDILAKPLENHELAVCLFNKSNKPKEMQISLSKLHSDPFVDLPIKASYEATNLWEKETFALKDKIQVTVAPHGVAVYKIKAID
jgi:alpha-galactosidase